MTHDVIEAPAAALVQKPAPPASASQPGLSVVQYAMQSGATPAELRELLALQRETDNHQLVLMREKRRMDEEDRERDATLSFRRDFAAFRGENIVVAKTTRVDRGKAGSFMQAELHAIAGLLSPALSKHGFSFRHDQRFGTKDFPADGSNAAFPAGSMVPEPWVYVTCFLEHSDGHSERLDLDGPPDNGTANGLIQNMQSSASMLKRLSLNAITGTATGGEDDENGLRRKATRREPDGGADEAGQADECETMLDAGRAEAMKGMKSLTAWWGALTAKQRTTMNSEFGGLRRCAAQADGGAR